MQVLHKDPFSVSLGHGDDPGRRSAHLPLLSSSLRLLPLSGLTRRAAYKHEVLSRNPTINPLSCSTLHLFKRSDSYAPASSGFRNVSDQLNLQKLLDENLFSSSTNSTHTPSPS
ncbi:hypothetical protein PTTG_25538 [Puccinia triticina 1-1 BBBD Race 1]|uniref:Uncharacterized protein n=2 Tax=Puccinia triticina TaxID=208348 RepID=A0A180H3B1_PUCT1|nr:uncharacterized protein PtA15_5A675 [Puccinia triticina]OAV98853.1 hypothetical protein PTTG_25538 [Puccinia triticina 1-1 BBBD Race 1]WAQ85101.1 hypothetical protein PtA15_5A675 [Puccinia triticina]WAR58435.1 hypothetical protein PtB15_5B669 [Puccinia triticina]